MKNVLVPMKDTQKKSTSGNFLAVQWLGLCSFTAEGQTSIPHWGTKSLQATWHSQEKKKKHSYTYLDVIMSGCDPGTASAFCKP